MTEKIAIVHDDFIQWGGAERLVATLAEVFPDAPIYTSMYDELVAQKARIDIARFRVSFLQKIPLKRKLNKLLFWLYPVAFEQIDFSEYDVVISSSARFAHCIITKPAIKHISYVNSPFRGFWDTDKYFGSKWYMNLIKFILSPIISRLRQWDFIAAQRADIVYGNSQTVVDRIKKYYRRDAEVFYPYVDFDRFSKEQEPGFTLPDGYFVVVSRLVEWKRIDLVINACNQLKLNLIIIGTGNYSQKLKSIAGNTIFFSGYLSDAETTYIMKRAQALIHPQKEDFGMTIIEANYCGIPVIAYQEGGATETVIKGKTGEFFPKQNVDSLIDVVKLFNPLVYSKDELLNNAIRFKKELFIQKWIDISQR